MTSQPPGLITVVGDSVGTLSAMLTHYRAAGIQDLIVHVHARSPEDQVLAHVRRISTACGAQLSCQVFKQWALADNKFLYSVPRVDQPNRWFLLADQDEFHVYPDRIEEIIKYCDRHGYDYVEGSLVDRLPRDGFLQEFAPHLTVWDQCPLGSILSARILGAVTNKIVLAKGHVVIGHGQHRAYSGIGCPPEDVYVPVHHFKWVPSVLPRLQSRATQLASGLYTKECQRFLAYYERAFRIQIEDPNLLAGACTPDYPFWGTIREWRIAATSFSPELARGYGSRPTPSQVRL